MYSRPSKVLHYSRHIIFVNELLYCNRKSLKKLLLIVTIYGLVLFVLLGNVVVIIISAIAIHRI